MKHLLIVTLGLFSLSFAQDSQILKEFSTGYNDFTTDVYKELIKSNSGNFIVCPLSADIVLALTNSGAQGQTAKELTTVLRLPENPERVYQIFRAVSPHLQSSKNYTLSSANKVYVKEGFKIHDQFKNVAVEVFDAEIQNIDFSRREAAADEINRWVEHKTHEKIKNLIKPDMLNDDTRTVLVNAIYFYGKWIKTFNARETLKLPFYINSRDSKNTDMMLATTFYEYYESSELNAKFLKLNYEGGDVSMHIVLPNEKEGLAALEERISEVLVSPDYKYEKVSVMIPKFRIDTTIKFKPILQNIGVRSAFGDGANFRGVGAEEDLKISEVVQKAFIEVDEKGTTAAAATGVLQVVVTSAQPVILPKLFHADHPFLFYLSLNKLGVNFFVGRYKSP